VQSHKIWNSKQLAGDQKQTYQSLWSYLKQPCYFDLTAPYCQELHTICYFKICCWWVEMSARFESSPHFDKLRNLVHQSRCCFLLIVSFLRFARFSFYGHPSSLFWFRKVSLLSLQLLICVFLRFDLNFDFCFWKRRWMSSTLKKVSRRLALGHWNLFCYL